jgi:hypothetical protein
MIETLTIWLLVSGLSGLCLVGAGLWQKKFPPKKINHLYGYRTKLSMRGQEEWLEAQKYSSKELLNGGILLICLPFLRLFFPALSEIYEVLMAVCMIIFICIGIFIRTERHLKNKFRIKKANFPDS